MPRTPMPPTPPDSIDALKECNISVVCPHCCKDVTLVPQHEPVNELNNLTYFVAHCPNRARLSCEPIFAVYQALNDRIVQRYPIPVFNESHFHRSIPAGVRADYSEAQRCMYAGAYKGAVVMLRRVVEAVACDKLGAEARNSNGNTKRLVDLIGLMNSKGLITADLKNTANEIRLFGNFGAHIQDDGLDNVSEDEAQDVSEVAWQLLSLIYIQPFRTNELRAKRQSRAT